ncbi:polysaccharide biosynthesis C-terminal domain-containing protein, partial [Vibrio breoganii]
IYIVLMLNVSILHFVLYSSSIALLLNMIFFSKSIGKIIININFDYLKECIYECNREKKKIINFSVISLAYYIYFASDTFVLGLLSSSDEVAYYSVMLLIVSTCLIPVGAVWSNYIKSETNHLTLLRKKAIFIYMSFSLMVGFICIISAYLYVHFVNYEYVNIKELSYVFFLYFPIKYINVLYELVCVKSNNTDYLVKVRSIAAIANISLNIIIIPMLGALGAAITTLFVEAVIFILLFIKMRKEIGQ